MILEEGVDFVYGVFEERPSGTSFRLLDHGISVWGAGADIGLKYLPTVFFGYSVLDP